MAVQTWTIGDVTVHCVQEIVVANDPDIVVNGVDAPLLAAHGHWLRPHYVTDDDRLLIAIQTYLVEADGVRIVVDTCLGNDRPLGGGPPLRTAYLDDIAALGFGRELVDVVLCTHLHLDHVGWNTMLVDGAWVPTFPNARYLFAEAEYEFWRTERNPFVDLRDTVDPIVEADLHQLVGPRHAITGVVSLVPTPGHTPGHVSVRISSHGASALISGDMLHHPIQIAAPDHGCPADWDEQQARETRLALLDDLAASGTLLLGTHFAEPAGGFVNRAGDTGFAFSVDRPARS